MILIPKPKLQFLLRGREITIILNPGKRQYRTGREYAVGFRHNHSVCRVQLVRLRETADGLELTLRPAETEPPRLLALTSGYVTDPARALPDEPEAVDERSQERMTAAASARDDELRRKRLKELRALPLEERVRNLEDEKRRKRLDISREMRVIQQRIDRAIDAI